MYRMVMGTGYHMAGDKAVEQALGKLKEALEGLAGGQVVSHTVTVLSDDYMVVASAVVLMPEMDLLRTATLRGLVGTPAPGLQVVIGDPLPTPSTTGQAPDEPEPSTTVQPPLF